MEHTHGNTPLPLRRQRGSIAGRLALALGVTALLGAALVGTVHDSVPEAAAGLFRHWGGRHGHGDPRSHAAFATRWMLRSIDATDDQQRQIETIVTELADDMVSLRDQHREHHDAFLAELARPTVDRDALQKLRGEEMALADQATSQVVDALADVAAILTLSQRADLLEAMHHFRH